MVTMVTFFFNPAKKREILAQNTVLPRFLLGLKIDDVDEAPSPLRRKSTHGCLNKNPISSRNRVYESSNLESRPQQNLPQQNPN